MSYDKDYERKSRGHGLWTMTMNHDHENPKTYIIFSFLTALGHECKTALSIDHNFISVMKVSEVSSNGNLLPIPFIQYSSTTTCLSQVTPAKTKRAPNTNTNLSHSSRARIGATAILVWIFSQRIIDIHASTLASILASLHNFLCASNEPSLAPGGSL